MPIDFDAIAAAFRKPLQAQLGIIAAAAARLGAWLGEELRRARATDRATQGIPTLLFVRGAVGARIAPFQRGVLVPETAPPTVWQRVGAGFERMGENTFFGERRSTGRRGLVGRMMTEATALPRAAAALARGADLIERAVAASVPPRPGVFSLTAPRTASDVFGGVGLAVYALYGGDEPAVGAARLERPLALLDRLWRTATALDWGRLAHPIQAALSGLDDLFPTREDEHSWQVHAAVVPRALTLPERLREVVHGIAGTLLVLPMLPPLARTLMQAADLRARLAVLDALEGVERRVMGLRQLVVDLFFETLPAYGTRAFDVLNVLGRIARRYVVFFTRFAWRYMRTLLGRTRRYLVEVIRFVRRLERLGRLIGDVVDAVLTMNMRQALLRSGGAPEWLLFALPDTLAEIVTALTTGGAEALRNQILGLIDAADDLTFGLAEERIEAAREVVGALIVDVGHVPAAAWRPYAGPRMPNVYETFVGPRTPQMDPRLARAFGGLAAGTAAAGDQALEDLAETFERSAREAARAGDVGRYAAVLAWADELAGTAFGDQAATLRARAGRRSPAARAFEQAFTRGGFYLVGAAVPRYIDALQDYWVERRLRQAEGRFAPPSGLPPYAAPTSPHLVDRRVRLGRVRLPRLTIRAGTHGLDDDLAGAVADHFREQVEAAYRAGLERVPP